MIQKKQIELLFLKAAQDEYILDKTLDDPEAPLEIIGFHAQQAAEKLLKAILVAGWTTYPQSHRIAELIDLIKAQGVKLPEKFEELRYLTPFAVEFRYDVLPEEPEMELDREQVRGLIKELKSWAEDFAKEKYK